MIGCLPDFYDFVTPCFPEDFSPLLIAVSVYNRSFSRMLDYLGHCSPCYDVLSLLAVMKWVTQYKLTLLGTLLQ